MASSDIWSTIHAERAALAADVDPLTDAQWATPSLCPGWSVRDVLGHMTATTEMTAPKFFAALIGSGFRFDTMIARAMRKQVEGTPADTLARFKAQVDSTTSPPGPAGHSASRTRTRPMPSGASPTSTRSPTSGSAARSAPRASRCAPPTSTGRREAVRR